MSNVRNKRNTMTRQAILTKYLVPTNFRGSRIKAICAAGTLVLPCDPRFDVVENHMIVAEALMMKLGWTELLVCGCLPTGDYAHVMVVEGSPH